jgi:hypothetical protein
MAKSRPPQRHSGPPARARGAGPAGRNHLKKATPWGAISFYGVIALVALSAVAYAAIDAGLGRSADNSKISGLREFGDLKQDHTTAAVQYPQSPPVGGPHDPVWQNCGVYDTAVRNENAVHAMEHGAVWITYRPDLPANQVATLRAKAQAGEYVLLSPYPALDQPIALSAWGRQVKVGTAGDARVDRFLRAYVRGPQTPEPGAPCTGGKSTP